jgi:DAK2 domain fusion protein YloV
MSGGGFLDAMKASLSWLEANALQINRLNVFPVPDGDTGTNMMLTLRAAVDEAGRSREPNVAEVARGLARGALLGARGNSGVILSQILRGVGDGLAGIDDLGVPDLARGLDRGALVAYEAVTDPVEGTILTVAADAAAAAREHASSTLEKFAEAVVDAARDSVERTPQLLPPLKEAGVVDAGGQGLLVMYEGMLRSMRGIPMPEIMSDERSVEVFSAFASAHSADEHGYCTEFVVHGDDLDAAVIRSAMGGLGGSLLVVGDATLLRIHIHTERPGDVITSAMAFGDLDAVKAENMDIQQAKNFAMALDPVPAVAQVPVVAVVSGTGLSKVFGSLGATIVDGGASMNPSTGEVLKALGEMDADWAIVLPNNANMLMAARQAAEQSLKDVRVLATRTVPQGIAALMAFNATKSVDANERQMCEAAGDVVTLEISRAVRDAQIDDLTIVEGQYIGFRDDELVGCDGEANELVKRMVLDLPEHESELATVYYGPNVKPEALKALVEDLETNRPELEVETISGGQELYDYVISIE